MKRIVTAALLFALIVTHFAVSGCGKSESAVREIVREEIKNDRENYRKSFAFQKFGFGGALEKEWSHAQGVKAGNLIFVSGQQPYDTNLDENGMPLTDKETGKSFAEQLRTVLENIEKVLANYNATMDDVVFLQGFVDENAGKNTAGFGNAAKVIQEFFPEGQQSMTFISVDNLYGSEQLIEANAIAVLSAEE
ncbi:MAG: RidA family protein [Candidatus Latescibacteria bacterium]|jgi:enamine deaminase RidA (YjgF/YER057c/UK114 family)|nr:RidA family protein [Candidatus Latescibacterota bacterium]